MNTFYEKADPNILNESNAFVCKNENSTGNYFVYRKALGLYIKLSQSLIDSHKEFDEAIKKEIDTIVVLEEGPTKDGSIARFNQAHYSLVLDQKAHTVLEKIEEIERKNRRK